MAETGKIDSSRRVLKSRSKPWAQSLAKLLTKSNVSPNSISVMSIVFSFLAMMSLLNSREEAQRHIWFVLAALFVQLRLLCNLMDGLVAVEGGKKTALGDLFNDVPDRIADVMIIVPLGYLISSNFSYAVELSWLAGLMAVFTAYLRCLGAALIKSHFYLGPMAKQHRMAAITFTLLLSAAVEWFNLGWAPTIIYSLLIVYNFGMVVTIIRRWNRIGKDLKVKFNG